jgi:hypothetical protein
MNAYIYAKNTPNTIVDENGLWGSVYLWKVHQEQNKKMVERYYSQYKIARWEISNVIYQLNRATVWMDGESNQAVNKSYMHAMTPELRPKNEAMKNANNYVRDRMRDAINKKNHGNIWGGWYEFGKALHTVQDSTSPMHHGFQIWTYDCAADRYCTAITHGSHERNWPGWGSNLDRASRTLMYWYSRNHEPSYYIFNIFGGDPMQ